MPAHEAPARQDDPEFLSGDESRATPADPGVTPVADAPEGPATPRSATPKPATPRRGFRYATPAMPGPVLASMPGPMPDPGASFAPMPKAVPAAVPAPVPAPVARPAADADPSEPVLEPSVPIPAPVAAPEPVPAPVAAPEPIPAPEPILAPEPIPAPEPVPAPAPISEPGPAPAPEPIPAPAAPASIPAPAPPVTPVSGTPIPGTPVPGTPIPTPIPAPVSAEVTGPVTPQVPISVSAAVDGARKPAHRVRPSDDLLNTVERLRMHVATLPLSLDLDGVEPARKERESLLSQLDDYLLPRLRRPNAPLLAVIGGSTGAGKSTLTNSLVRREVSRSGVLRPTTRSPVLIHHPYDSGSFMTQRILPRLERITSEGAEPLQPIDPHAPRITALRLVPHDGLTPGLALIDAPDIDSLVETNRDLAVQLLGAADLWIFVTTAARYADAMPWQMLKQAADRGVAVAVVLDRVPPESLQDLRVHLATRLRDNGLGGAPLFAIPETEVGVDGFLPERVVQPLLTWLRRVAGDERSRQVIAERTLKGVVGSIPARAQLLAQAANQQAHGWVSLSEDVEAVFARVRADLLSGLSDGSLVSGDVLARWQEHIADGALIRRLDGKNASLSDRVTSAMRREGESVQPLDIPVTQAAAASIQAAMRSAIDEIVHRWRARPGGESLLAARGQKLASADLASGVRSSLEDWRSVLINAAEELAASPTGEPVVDPDAVIDVLFVATIDETTDETNGLGTANPTVAAARRILGSFAGDDEIASVVSAARADLVARAAALVDGERIRLEGLLDAGGTDARRGEALLAAANAVEEAGVR